MRTVLIALSCAALVGLCGCRAGRLGESVVKNQEESASGLLYMDSLFTDDGRSRLTGEEQ